MHACTRERVHACVQTADTCDGAGVGRGAIRKTEPPVQPLALCGPPAIGAVVVVVVMDVDVDVVMVVVVVAVAVVVVVVVVW